MRLSTVVNVARAFVVVAGLACQMGAQTARPRELPLKYAGPPTKAEITAGDLMTRLYIFADDSMGGRQVGTEFNNKGTAYIEREVRRLGLVPAGDSGGYFQYLPTSGRVLDAASTITVDHTVFKAGEDFVARVAGGRVDPVKDAPVVFFATGYDTANFAPMEAVRGKTAVLNLMAVPGEGEFMRFVFSLPNPRAFVGSAGFQRFSQSLASAAAVVFVAGEHLSAGLVQETMASPQLRMSSPATDTRVPVIATVRVGEALMGRPLAGLAPGASGRTLTTNVGSPGTELEFAL